MMMLYDIVSEEEFRVPKPPGKKKEELSSGWKRQKKGKNKSKYKAT